ncbi:hypothetical protein ANO11243_084470 [Dothideomycetidae sp. 11243]|nr:hypothetical protein ANO11243_084470 [fungal sp. No.11243]
MDQIPPECLRQICLLLDRPSAGASSLTAKRYRPAANEVIFRAVHLKSPSADTMRQKIEQCEMILNSTDSLRHVRELKVARLAHEFGCVPFEAPEDCGDRPMDTWTYQANDESTSVAIDQDAEWLPLAALMQKLVLLRDLEWCGTGQLPPCVLKVLHTQMPQCRLHMRSFSLRSFVQSPGKRLGIDAHELELATSPNLHSVAMRYDAGCNTDGHFEYNDRAILDLVSGRAPNLQEVSICPQRAASSPRNHMVWRSRVRAETWRGDEIPVTESDKPTKPLRCLELLVMNSHKPLLSWLPRIDLTQLRQLKLHSGPSPEEFTSLCSHCFPLLEELVLHSPQATDAQSAEVMTTATEEFLVSLPPLTSLKLTGRLLRLSTLQVALGHHGQQLRVLRLGRKIRQQLLEVLDLIRESCPLLQELGVPVIRSRGDAKEVALYRAIGGLRNLRRAHLSLYCSERLDMDDSELTDHDREEFYAQPNHRYRPTNGGERPKIIVRNVDVRNAMINYAVDEALARAIFKVISDAKDGSVVRLETLTVAVHHPMDAGGLIGNLPFEKMNFFDHMRRGWTCSLQTADRPIGDCIVERYDTRLEDTSRDDGINDDYDEDGGGTYNYRRDPLTDELKPFFRELWPVEGPEGDWRKDWHSFPLAELESTV